MRQGGQAEKNHVICPKVYRLFQRDIDLILHGERVDGQLCYRHRQTQGKRTAVQPQLRGIALNIIGGIAAFIGFIVQDFGVVVKHQHHIGNALRKFESAGVIESRSSGMKGTYIKVVNDLVYEELDRIKKNM